MGDMMTPPRGLGPPGDYELRDMVTGDDHPYVTWDAAYVLGSLSAADRREFEAHLAACPACREAVAELSGMPALLSQLDRAEVAAIGESGSAGATPSTTPEMLPALLATVRWRRRRTYLVTWAASAVAAAVIGIGVLIGIQGHSPASLQQVAVTAQPMAQVGTSLLTSTVSLSSRNWGTFIDLRCVCLAPPNAHHDTLAMMVVGRDGSKTRLATWVAEPGHTATPAGSVSTPVDQIAAVQVVAADSGQVLLERSL
jgi:anti-sigma factor RsiW